MAAKCFCRYDSHKQQKKTQASPSCFAFEKTHCVQSSLIQYYAWSLSYEQSPHNNRLNTQNSMESCLKWRNVTYWTQTNVIFIWQRNVMHCNIFCVYCVEYLMKNIFFCFIFYEFRFLLGSILTKPFFRLSFHIITQCFPLLYAFKSLRNVIGISYVNTLAVH